MIDYGKEVDVRAQEKGTSIDERQQTGITLYFLILFPYSINFT